MRIYDLKTDNRINNNNIGRKNPVFGWKAEGRERNIRQESYRIRVWRTADGNGGSGERIQVWDSLTVMSSLMANIPYEGEALSSDSRYEWEAELTLRHDGGAETVKGGSWFETGLFNAEDWKGEFIGETRDHVYHLYRKSFVCGGPFPDDETHGGKTSLSGGENYCGGIKRAKLYICGLGHFECWLNGRRVSDHVLEPGWTDYDKTCFYTAYDVTGLVEEGRNGLVVKLGDGMFNVPGGRYVYYERSYGKCRLLAQLEVTLGDGSRLCVVSDASWKMVPSPVRFCCIYGGEDYDGRLWRPEYLAGDYVEDARWEQVSCVEPPKGRLAAMPMEPVKVMKTYIPVSVKRTEKGAWLYDLGTNFSGWARIRIHTDGKRAGEKIVLKPGELLKEDGAVNQRVTGEGYAWTYILNEQEEQEFAPDFTYTGFRYVEMTGAVPDNPEGRKRNEECGGGLPVLTRLQGEFLYPDVEQAGDFQCSNELFNDIHQIVRQAILSNTKSYFTDCPHREKLGWLEETHLIGPSIMYNLDVHNLYAKVEGDMADSQRENGLVADICPEYVTGFGKWHQGFVDSPEWGSACILNPWYVYKRYGDISLISRYYDTMKRYLDYLGGRTHHEILHHGLGDWLDIGPCTPHSQNTPVPVTATCIYYYDLDVMCRAAGLLGKTEDAVRWGKRMEEVFREYNLQFLDNQTGRYANGSQTAQAMSLMVGLAPEEMKEKVKGQLKEDIVKRSYAVTAGDIGHPFLIAALMKYGMTDLLNTMTNITQTPGYGYQVVNGATTLTEEWDGPEPGCPHGSQNHLMLGSIEEWFYGGLGGLELVRDSLPFGEIRIAPRPEKDVEQVSVWVMHPYGKVSVSWRREGDGVVVDAVVPPNVTAHLETPDGRLVGTVGSGSHRYRF